MIFNTKFIQRQEAACTATLYFEKSNVADIQSYNGTRSMQKGSYVISKKLIIAIREFSGTMALDIVHEFAESFSLFLVCISQYQKIYFGRLLSMLGVPARLAFFMFEGSRFRKKIMIYHKHSGSRVPKLRSQQELLSNHAKVYIHVKKCKRMV